MKISFNYIFVFLIASYTFFGVSILQGISCFSDFGNEIQIDLTLSTEEEQQEESKKENKINFHYLINFSSENTLELSKQLFRPKHISCITHFAEIPTPPPEYS